MTAKTKQMSPVDSAWLHMEEPTNLMMITGVSLLDEPPDFERFRKTLEVRLLTLDRFTMRVVESVLPVGTPHWEADPNFDLDAHIHRVALPEPGDMAELQRLISDLASTPLDYSKPLWNIHLVENVAGGAAMVLRLHHCIGDGTAMNAILFRLMDMARDAPIGDVEEPATEAPKRRDFVSTVFRPVRSIGNALRYLAHEGSESLRHPSRIAQGAGAAAEAAGIVGRVLLMTPDAKTPFKGPLGVQKRVAWSDNVPLSDVKTVTKALGAKVNDVMLSALAGGLRDYLIARNADVSDLEIRAVIPVDLREPQRGIELGNAFGLVFLALPLSIADPVERLRETKKRMDAIKASIEAVTFYSLLNIFGVSPRQVEEQGLNIFGSRATAVVTNVRGPGQALYIAGSKIENIMGWVPQAGHLGLGVSIFSYDGKVSVGVITDAGLVPDPEQITTHFRARFDEHWPSPLRRTKHDLDESHHPIHLGRDSRASHHRVPGQTNAHATGRAGFGPGGVERRLSANRGAQRARPPAAGSAPTDDGLASEAEHAGDLEAIEHIVDGLARENWKDIRLASARNRSVPPDAADVRAHGRGRRGVHAACARLPSPGRRHRRVRRAQDAQAVLQATSNTLQACTSCHAQFRQEVVDAETWTARTGQAHAPTMRHGGH